jgi:hypothetical protein
MFAMTENKAAENNFAIAVIGRSKTLWLEAVFPKAKRFELPGDFADNLTGGRGRLGVVLPRRERELEDVLAHLEPKLNELLLSTARVLVYAPTGFSRAAGLYDMMRERLVDFYPPSVSGEDFKSLIEIFSSVNRKSLTSIPPPEALDMNRALKLMAPARHTDSLHNGKSGRLDIKLVSELFGLTVSELARLIVVEEKTALKTTDSKIIHEKLLPFEQVAEGLDLMGGDPSSFKRWLRTANAELSNRTPLALIEEGQVDELAGIVLGALLGQTG